MPIDEFTGEPNGAPLAWWFNTLLPENTERPQLDEILLDENGRCCGKGACGARFYTHVMLAGFERPEPPFAGRRL